MAWIVVHFATSVWMIFLSRALVGCSNAFVATTVFTVEIASTDLRGSCSLLEAVLRQEVDPRQIVNYTKNIIVLGALELCLRMHLDMY